MRFLTALCWLVGLAASLGAQAPQLRTAKGRELIVLLRDPSRLPVAGAQGWLRCEAASRLLSVVMASNLPLAALPKLAPVTATSNQGGLLRFAVGESASSAGSGIVTTKEGLGALIPRLHGRPSRITLQPMAQVSTATGSEAFSLWARAFLPNGERIDLPPMHGTESRLPEGSYEIWAHSPDGWIWQRLDLRRGTRTNLSFGGAVQRLQVPAGASVHPEGRASVPLLLANDGTITLRGAALAAPLVTWLNGCVTAPRVAPGPPTREAMPWPPLADRHEPSESFFLAKDTPAEATLLGLVLRDDNTFRIVAYANATRHQNTPGNRRVLRMPKRPVGDPWLLSLANGRAPHAQPWSTTADGSTLRPPLGRDLTVVIKDKHQRAITDCVVEFLPEDQLAAALVARTDARGHARFGLVIAPGAVRTSDARYRNQEVELIGIPKEPLPIVATEGSSFAAVATFQDAHAAGSIVVTLRDANGELRPSQRTVTTQPGEAFSFVGLLDDRDLVLFATAQRDGKTWSARRIVRAGDEEVRLVLRNEDPKFVPVRR